MKEAGSGVELEFIDKTTDQTITSTGAHSGDVNFHKSVWTVYHYFPSAEEDPWYSALMRAFNKNQLKVMLRDKHTIIRSSQGKQHPRIATARIWSQASLKWTIHQNCSTTIDHDKFLNEKIFLKCIDIFVDLSSCLIKISMYLPWL